MIRKSLVEHLKRSGIENFASAKSQIYGKHFVVERFVRTLTKMNLNEAIARLSFVSGKYAKAIYKILNSSRSNAANKGMNENDLIINRFFVGRGHYLYRTEFKGRGRVGRKTRPYCNMQVFITEDKKVING